ncbi:MAG TPA: hypothetical protein PLK34_01520 [Candidatus Pacearchaeota archaeon]|nr:hypothetical protein [Candidatus Pacearchaeota archaeon]
MPRKKKAEDSSENEETQEVSKLERKELEKAAEAESTEGSKEAKALEEKRKKILEKAKKLAEGVDVTELEDLKKQVKGEKKTEMLVPLEDYIRSGVYIGTKVVTPNMWEYVHRRRADGLAIFNTDLIDAKIKEAVEYLAKFQPNEIILVCKRQAGWKAAEMFSQLTGVRVFTKKYPAGILTNLTLPDFFENELTIVCDAWVDKNALNDTLRVKKKVLMICDTNNFTKGADKIVIGNNKSSRSLGLIFYLLTKGYCEKMGIEKDIPELNFWIGDRGEAEDEARRKAKIGAKYGV